MTSKLLFKYDVISGVHCVSTAKNIYNRNFIVIPLFLKELSSNLVQEVKAKSLIYIFSSNITFVHYPSQTRQLLLNVWSLFSQTCVRNEVSTATA